MNCRVHELEMDNLGGEKLDLTVLKTFFIHWYFVNEWNIPSDEGSEQDTFFNLGLILRVET